MANLILGVSALYDESGPNNTRGCEDRTCILRGAQYRVLKYLRRRTTFSSGMEGRCSVTSGFLFCATTLEA
jgi:hypothetical protein